MFGLFNKPAFAMVKTNKNGALTNEEHEQIKKAILLRQAQERQETKALIKEAVREVLMEAGIIKEPEW